MIPVKINYLSKNYSILGICNIISVEEERGFGRMVVYLMMRYLDKEEKTCFGFCPPKIPGFYRRYELKVEKDFIKRFQYRNPKTGKIGTDEQGDGVYYEGKSHFIGRVLSAYEIVCTNVHL